MARQNIGLSSLEKKEQLLRKLFSEYSPERWKKCCEHVKKIEDKYCEEDGIVDSEVNTSYSLCPVPVSMIIKRSDSFGRHVASDMIGEAGAKEGKAGLSM